MLPRFPASPLPRFPASRSGRSWTLPIPQAHRLVAMPARRRT